MSTYSGKCGENLEWHYNDVTCELSIFGNGIMDDFEDLDDGDKRPWAGYATKVKTITIGKCVKSIGTMAFNEFSSLESIEIPKSVERIGDTAFASCTSLKNVYFTPNCSNGFAVVFEFGAFYECKNLQSVTMPLRGNLSDSEVFHGCSSLRSIIIPKGTKCIYDYTFSDCESLVEVRVPDTVECIETDAFYECKNLKHVVIPKSVKKIGIFEIED